MIGWALLVTLAALLAIAFSAHRAKVRTRRERRELHHIIGCEQWWGKR